MTALTTDIPTRLALGAGMAVGAAFLISVQDVIIKLVGGTLPLWQIFALRGVVAVPAIAIFAILFFRRGDIISGAFRFWPLMRSLSITIGLFCFYAALPFISLSTAGAGIYLAPIFMALLSSRLLSEPVGLRGWFGVALGFAGVLVLLRPGTDAVSAWALLPVIGAVFYGLGHIITRARCREYPSGALALSYILAMALGSALISGALLVLPLPTGAAERLPYLLGPWSRPTGQETLALVALGALIIGVGILLAGAYKAAPPSAVGTFEYSYLPFAILWDVLFFDTPPDGLKLLGIAMIVAAGILVLTRRSG